MVRIPQSAKLALALLLAIPTATFAQQSTLPKPPRSDAHFGVFHRLWKPVAVSVFVMGSSLAATHWAHECRVKFGPAPCDGGYGAFAAREGVRGGMSFTMDLMSLYGRKKGYREWALPALGWGTYNVYVAVHQSRIGCPAGEHFLYGTKFTCVPDSTYWPPSSAPPSLSPSSVNWLSR